MSRRRKESKEPAEEAESYPLHEYRQEVKGAIFLFFALISLVSTLSFAYGGRDRSNWLGLIGGIIGKVWFGLIGVGAYPVLFFIAWVGWRYLMGRSTFDLGRRFFQLVLLVSAINLIFSLVEDSWPQLTYLLADVSLSHSWAAKQRYHLGGALFYYLYRDLPGYSLLSLFNALGVACLAIAMLAFSLLKMTNTDLYPVFLSGRDWLKAALSRLKKALSASDKSFSHAPLASAALPSEMLPKEKCPSLGFSSEDKDAERLPMLLNAQKKLTDAIRQKANKREIAKEQLEKPFASSFTSEKSLNQPLGQLQPPTKRRAELMLQAVSESAALIEEPEKDDDVKGGLLHQERGLKQNLFEREKEQTKEFQKDEFQEEEFEEEEFEERGLETPEEDLLSEEKRQRALTAQRIYNGDWEEYELPSAQLLSAPKEVDVEELWQVLRLQAKVLEETCLNFGIEARVGNINCGPTITSFEVHPAVGVKVQRIKALANDLALNLEARSLRIIAPIPGKACVGIEIPNPQPQEVSFQELLSAYRSSNKRFHIPLLLGKAVNGEMVMSDLAKMPHLIIAGATGSGKSVCINTIVMSIVLNAKPNEIKLLMVDPKKVELTPYTRMPHMLAPVITEPQGACCALQWLVKEMERRYELLKMIGLRNIDSFNKRIADAEREASLRIEIPPKLHYIVAIIDELADLMMVSSNDIETYIARIAQMARAVGIHLILATQRPSREVITGLIKANFPTRIAFKVSSRVNSQIILDDVGAETLLGNGDMLFLPPGTSHLTRVQGAFISDADINRVVEHVCSQAPPRYEINSFDEMAQSTGDGDGLFDEDEQATDQLFGDAKQVILSTGNASTTFLQRKLKIGYARAASLMDQLEKRGIVGPADGSRPRKILARGSSLDDEEGDDEDDYEEDDGY